MGNKKTRMTTSIPSETQVNHGWTNSILKQRGLLITLVPKFYNNVFLLVSLTTLETFIKFDWLVY